MRVRPVFATFLLAACALPAPARTGAGGWSAAPLSPATDLDPAPSVVELTLTAAPARWEFAPGQAIDGYAYNGTFPGPTIEAHVGDTIVVHFRNALPEPTTVHWHGVRVPVAMDGAPHSQDPVPPGGTFEYRFVVPDAGTFWYHPHFDEPEQMERGLYGAIVVRGDDEPVVDAETVVMLDDLLLDASGALAPFGGLLEVHGGREGDTQLVNGRLVPTIPVRTGERQRWRIVNAGSARIYDLALDGHAFTIIGSDGGFWPAAQTSSSIVLAPGDRLDVLVDVETSAGATSALVAQPYSRGHGQGIFAPVDVLRLVATSDTPLSPLPPYESATTIAPLDASGTTPQQVTFGEQIDATSVTFLVNGQTYPDVTPIPATVGAVQVWDLVNTSEMSHPFHLHGFFFQILSVDGTPTTMPTWEDTFELRGMQHVRIAFRPDDRPGMWMFHCHILEHAHAGMMGMVELTP